MTIHEVLASGAKRFARPAWPEGNYLYVESFDADENQWDVQLINEFTEVAFGLIRTEANRVFAAFFGINHAEHVMILAPAASIQLAQTIETADDFIPVEITADQERREMASRPPTEQPEPTP